MWRPSVVCGWWRVLASLAVLAYGCGRQADRSAATKSATSVAPKRAPSPLDSTSIHFSGNDVVERDPNGIVWEMRSPQTEIKPGSALATVQSVDAYFYEGGRRSLHVKAPEATVDNKLHLLSLDRGVVAESVVERAGFTADHLRWRWKASDGIEGDGNIRLTRGSAVVTAGRLIADIGLRKARLLDHPVAVAPPGSM